MLHTDKELELRKAAASGNLAVVKRLHEEKVNLNAAGSDTQKTALHRAAHNGHLSVAEFLVTHGADINSQDRDGNGPLYTAITTPDVKLVPKIEMISLLVKKEANPLISNQKGETPLMQILKIRDDKTVASMPHTKEAVRQIIRGIKLFVAKRAQQKKCSAQISPNGVVTFFNVTDKVGEESVVRRILASHSTAKNWNETTIVELTSSNPPVIPERRF